MNGVEIVEPFDVMGKESSPLVVLLVNMMPFLEVF